jgi:3'-phosphoadenosine 5'-phosphosulfate sulfotransferase (PAPS reductase)/FAD synthetase
MSGADRLTEMVERSWAVLDGLRGTSRWLLAFSGGKDSTTVLVLTVEFLRRRRPAGVSLEILYADTLLEIPPMARHAERMLAHAEALAEAEGLPLRVQRLRPPPDQTFWVLVLGKGYPVPSFRFRWCTDRLKVRPMRRAAEQGDPNAVMLVGVREGESAVRDGRLRQTCGRGECGPAAVGKAGPFPAVSPIREWRSCDVWDFLVFRAPAVGLAHRRAVAAVWGGRGGPLRLLAVPAGAQGPGASSGDESRGGGRAGGPGGPGRLPGAPAGNLPGSRKSPSPSRRAAWKASPGGEGAPARGAPRSGEADRAFPPFPGGGGADPPDLGGRDAQMMRRRWKRAAQTARRWK